MRCHTNEINQITFDYIAHIIENVALHNVFLYEIFGCTIVRKFDTRQIRTQVQVKSSFAVDSGRSLQTVKQEHSKQTGRGQAMSKQRKLGETKAKQEHQTTSVTRQTTTV